MSTERLVRFVAYPDEPKPRKRNRKPQEPGWTAPEHGRFAKHMKRAYPISYNGRKMVELGRELVLDPRPEIMQPKPESIFLGIES